VAPSTEAAVAMGPAIMVLFIVFGGYYVNADNVPVCFKWINKAGRLYKLIPVPQLIVDRI
jgi:hypothetical protein